MKQLITTLALAAAFLVLSSAPIAGSLAHAGVSPQEAEPVHQKWEYEVVGLSEIYGSTFDYLKDAFEGDKSDLLKLAKRTDDQLVAKTRDLLNEYGAQGWELAEYRENVLVFKRPVR